MWQRGHSVVLCIVYTNEKSTKRHGASKRKEEGVVVSKGGLGCGVLKRKECVVVSKTTGGGRYCVKQKTLT